MKKLLSSIIILIYIFSIGKTNFVSADFFEDFLNLETGLEEISFEFYTLENPKLKDSKYQKQYYILNKINSLIKESILKQYKAGKFGYYQTNGLVTHYNNFIYYSNKYFSSLKDIELYGKTKETQNNLYKNMRDMKFHYLKFQTLALKKDMN